MLEFLQPIWNGLVVGSIVALAALGFTLIFGILNFLHVAYAEYITAGAYAAFAANVMFGVPIVASFLVGVVVVAVLSVVFDKLVFTHFSGQGPVILIIVSLALGIVLQNVIRVFWGNNAKRLDIPIQRATDVAGLRILPNQVLIIVAGLLILAGVHLLLRRTRIGIAMRATSDDMLLAEVRGVPTDRVITYTWLASGAIAGAAGVFLAVETALLPLMGFTLLPAIFAAVVLGGVGDPLGAIIGGYTIGIAEELSVLVLPASYKPAVGLIVLVLVLVWRPSGVFGTTTR